MNEKLLVAEKLLSLIPDMSAEDIAAMLEYPADKKMGDLALPCFKLSKIMRKAPPMIASALKEGIDADESCKGIFDEVQSVNGYLNFFIIVSSADGNTVSFV